MAVLSLPPLALYIHVPWCEKKCPYCDFNSHVSSHIDESAYLACLLRDAKTQIDFVQGRNIQSIFIGGGTPSLLSPKFYQALLSQLQNTFTFAQDIEITLEANPSSSEQEKFAGFKAAGITRLSIGVQSFNNSHLQSLGRIHQSAQAVDAITAAKAAGFEHINADLMHGLPMQTPADALNDLQQAIALGVDHVSWYQLTIEQNTEFFRAPPALPEEDCLSEISEAGFTVLQEAGFSQYEISAFSLGENAQAKHNINYWQFGDYLAIGAGAHGKVTNLKTQQILRFNNTRSPKDYMARIDHYRGKLEAINKEDWLFEALMNCLRLNNGMATEKLLQYTASSKSQLLQLCQTLIDQKLLVIDDRVKATDLGRQYLNTVLSRLLDQ